MLTPVGWLLHSFIITLSFYDLIKIAKWFIEMDYLSWLRFNFVCVGKVEALLQALPCAWACGACKCAYTCALVISN